MKHQQVFTLTKPESNSFPILLSFPHSGTAFPDDFNQNFCSQFRENPVDTDWFVDQLYDFANELGLTTIKAHYSRYVIDLNRSPSSMPLYSDQRLQTELVPTTTFDGSPLYKHRNPQSQEVLKRQIDYYDPYYRAIENQLAEFKIRWKQVLFFDCHSIRRMVPTIQNDAFPDLILGDRDETSCHSELIRSALESLKSSQYQVSHNHPFKGGHLTRTFGRPSDGIHALQLEMCQDLYLNDARTQLDKRKIQPLKSCLGGMFKNLISCLARGL